MSYFLSTVDWGLTVMRHSNVQRVVVFLSLPSPCNQGDYSLSLARSERFTAGEYATRFYGGVRLLFLHPAERNHSLVFVLLASSLSVLTSLFSETSVIALYFHCVHAVFKRTIALVARSHKLSQFWCASI
jgi:hypothetical protein